ncbi:MAG: hypothetical protein WAL77_10855 [Candidatus Dormiibacterota bacterium]
MRKPLILGVAALLAVVSAVGFGGTKVARASNPCYYSVFQDPLGNAVYLANDHDWVNETLSIWSIRGAGSVGCTAWANHHYGDTEVEISWYTVNGTLLRDGPNNPDVSLSLQAWFTDTTYQDQYFTYQYAWMSYFDPPTDRGGWSYLNTGGGPPGTASSGNFVSPIIDLNFHSNDVCGLVLSDGWGHPGGGGAAHTRYVDYDGYIYITSGHVYTLEDYLGC